MRAKAINCAVFACEGHLFPRGQWVKVPEGFEEEALRNPFLEIEPEPEPKPAPEPEPEPEPAPEPDIVDYSTLTVAELRIMAEARNLDPAGLRKAELVNLLEEGGQAVT